MRLVLLKMLPTGNSINVLSANCQGLQNYEKRCDVLSYLKEKQADIICLQDTHWADENYENIKELWGGGGECFIKGIQQILEELPFC